MACRVGMSRDPEERMAYWAEEEGHTHGTILHENLSYEQATHLEKIEADKRGCVSKSGGPKDSNNDWAVYVMSGGRQKRR